MTRKAFISFLRFVQTLLRLDVADDVSFSSPHLCLSGLSNWLCSIQLSHNPDVSLHSTGRHSQPALCNNKQWGDWNWHFLSGGCLLAALAVSRQDGLHSPQSVCLLFSKNIPGERVSVGLSLLWAASSWRGNTHHTYQCWPKCPDLLSASKQEAGNGFFGGWKWIFLAASLLLLRLGGCIRTPGWPAEPTRQSPWAELPSEPSASVSSF